MKKFTALIIAAVMLFSFSACNRKRSDILPLTAGISFDCEITYYNECYEAAAKVTEDGEMSCEITAPDTLKGLKFSFSGDDVTAEYNGLEYKNDISSLPQGAAFTSLYQILRTAEKAEVISDDDKYYVRGNAGNLHFKLFLGATGLPIYAEDPDSGLEISFKNMTVG